MIPLHHDPHYTFRFTDDRIIPRFHLEGVEAGRRLDGTCPVKRRLASSGNL